MLAFALTDVLCRSSGTVFANCTSFIRPLIAKNRHFHCSSKYPEFLKLDRIFSRSFFNLKLHVSLINCLPSSIHLNHGKLEPIDSPMSDSPSFDFLGNRSFTDQITATDAHKPENGQCQRLGLHWSPLGYNVKKKEIF